MTNGADPTSEITLKLLAIAKTATADSNVQRTAMMAVRDAMHAQVRLLKGNVQTDTAPLRDCLNEIYQILRNDPENRALREAASRIEGELEWSDPIKQDSDQDQSAEKVGGPSAEGVSACL